MLIFGPGTIIVEENIDALGKVGGLRCIGNTSIDHRVEVTDGTLRTQSPVNDEAWLP
jgi:hypothetical protein